MRNLIIFMVSLMSCTANEPVKQAGNYEVTIIDGCEYLFFGGIYANNTVLTHKGNCSNSIHKCNCK